MKIVLISGDSLRHLFFLKTITGALKGHEIFYLIEKKGESYKIKEKEKKHFDEWYPDFYFVSKKQNINNNEIIKAMNGIKPDYFFTFGCSILKKDFFSIAKKGCINIHSGLVQYYRGVENTLWALYENQTERIGATVHFINEGIDTGGVIAQAKTTNIRKTDTLQDAFLKTCTTGIILLKDNISDIINNNFDKTKKAKGHGKLIQNKDINDKIRTTAKYNLTRIL